MSISLVHTTRPRRWQRLCASSPVSEQRLGAIKTETYAVKINDMKASTKKQMDLLVMENLFYKQTITQKYDLKGIGMSLKSPNLLGNDRECRKPQGTEERRGGSDAV